MKPTRHVPFLAFLLLVATSLASAQPAVAQGIGSSKTLGIGLELGHGAGLSVKLATSASSSLQFGLDAYNYGHYRTYYKNHGRVYYGYQYGLDPRAYLIHGEFLSNQGTMVRARSFVMPWYVGAGLDLGVGVGTAFGVHGNLGLAVQLTSLPLDFFAEWTPRLWLVDFVQLQAFSFNAGVRVWF